MLTANTHHVTVAIPVEAAEDGPTFRDLFEKEFAYVRCSARRLGIREREVEDLVHEVFLAVHRKLPEFERGRPVRPWLFGITFRVVAGHKRRLGYYREQLSTQDEPDEHADEQPAADETLATEERRRMVHEALDSLDDERRAIFILHELDEVPMAELARALNIPTNTAYSRLRLARQAFKRSLRRILLSASRPEEGTT